MNAPIRGCTGKVAFGTFAKAARAAQSLRRRQDDAHVAPYHCQHCNGYHVGEDDTGGRLRKGRARVVRGTQAVTLAQFKAMFAEAADDRPEGESACETVTPPLAP